MAWLALIRHGLTEWNLAGRIQGRSDVPLCDVGINKLRELKIGEDFINANWVASPLQRAQQTAAILNPNANIKTVPQLAETDWGDFCGVLRVELPKRVSELKLSPPRGLDFTPPNGESPRQVRARFVKWMQELDGKQNVVAVTHKGVIRAAISAMHRWDMQDNLNEFLRSKNCFGNAKNARQVDWQLPIIIHDFAGTPRVAVNCDWESRVVAH